MRKIAALIVLSGLAGVWLARRQLAEPTTTTGEAEAEQDAGISAAWWQLGQALEGTFTPASVSSEDTAAANVAAFLLMIRMAEGTAGENGYRTLFGGRLFDGWADHPRIAQKFRDGAGRELWTTAAGAYQFLAVSPIPGGGSTRMDTWDRLAAKLGLPDFSPASQDAAAVELIREAGALGDVRAGRIESAVGKVRGIWASMPGAGYAQPEKSFEALRLAYLNAGGTLA